MNEIDAKIIEILCKDARTSFSKIGRSLSIGKDTIFRRFNNLKQEGKVEKSTVIVSSKGIGIKGWCGIFIEVKQGASASVVKDNLLKLPQVFGISPTMGDYDFYLEMGFREIGEVDDFINNLKKIQEITTIDPIVYATHDWPLPTIRELEPDFLEWMLSDE